MEPFLSRTDIEEGTSKGLKKYKNKNFLERFAMFLGSAQMLELGLKNLLNEKYGYDFEKMEKWTLGTISKKLEENKFREDFIQLLNSVVDYRNYVTHELIINRTIYIQILGNKLSDDHYDKYSRILDKAIIELEQLIFLFEWTTSNDGWD